jgi:hypothetical protein
MSKQLLHTSQVRPALKQVCRRAVSQPVWTQVGGVGYGAESAMNDLAGGPSAQPSTPHADEQGVSGFLGGEYGSTDREPVPYRAPGRLAIGDGALLAALAHHSHDPAIAVEVGTIESDELTDSDAGRIQQLQHRPVTHSDRVLGGGVVSNRFQQRRRLVLAKHVGESPGSFRTGQQKAGIEVE